MKKSLFVLLFLTSAGATQLQAQLFQKLKDKVSDKLGGGKSRTAPLSSASPSTDNTPVIDFAKYDISTQVAYNPAEIKGKTHQLMLEQSVYKIAGGRLTADVVCYSTDRDMGEAGNFSATDAAYVFENGALLPVKKVSEIEQDQNLKAEYSRLDWPYNYTGDMKEFYPDGNPMNFTFNGKSYKNYMVIMGMVMSKDKKKFYAVGGENGNGEITYYLFTEGKRIKLPSLSAYMMYNIDFSAVGVYGFVNRLEDENKKTDNALQAAANVMNGGDVYFNDGTVRKNATMTANAWLDPSGKNILFADRRNGNYINGKKVGADGSDQGKLWCNADGSRWACVTASGNHPGHLVFYDGADIPNAVHPQQWALSGKTYMVWLQYRNMYTGDLLLCTKEL